MKFKFAFEKGGKYLLKIELNDGQDKWATTNEEVFNFAKENLKENEECSFDYTETNGQLFISKVIKDGESVETKEKGEEKMPEYKCEDCGKELPNDKYKKCYDCNKKNKSDTTAPKCEDCGKELKDGKFKKCYACNQKNPSTKYGGKKESIETSEQIKRLSVLRATAQAIMVMQGQVSDSGVLGDMMEVLYKRLYGVVSN